MAPGGWLAGLDLRERPEHLLGGVVMGSFLAVALSLLPLTFPGSVYSCVPFRAPQTPSSGAVGHSCGRHLPRGRLLPPHSPASLPGSVAGSSHLPTSSQPAALSAVLTRGQMPSRPVLDSGPASLTLAFYCPACPRSQRQEGPSPVRSPYLFSPTVAL